MDDGGGLKLEPCDPATIIIDVLQRSKEAADKPGVETQLDLDPLSPLLIDKEKLTFAVKQLIENAFKFSGETGRVAVSLKAREDMVLITIEDTGIGIAKEDLPKVFEKFYQVDSAATGQIRGFGLGLYYTREFVRLHGGSIAVESELGKGTRVTVALPVRQA